MRQTLSLILVLLVLALAAFGFWYLSAKLPVQNDEQSQGVGLTKEQDGQLRRHEETPLYLLDVVVVPADEPIYGEQITAATVALIDERFAVSRANFELPPPELPSEAKNAFYAEAAPSSRTDETYSMLVRVSDYFAGAAHPNHDIMTLVFSRKTGARLSFSDVAPGYDEVALWKEIEDALVLAKVARAAENGVELSAEDARENLSFFLGTENRAALLERFTVDAAGTRFWFPPYVAGAYAEGDFNIVIPTIPTR